MVLDIAFFRNPDTVKQIIESEKRRFHDPTPVHQITTLDQELRLIQIEIDNARNKRNTLSKTIGKSKIKDPNMINEVKQIKELITTQEARYSQLQLELTQLINTIGNLVDQSVPISQNEKDNVIIHQYGELTSKPYTHDQLLVMIGGCDLTQGSQVMGHRGYYLMGPALLLSLTCQNLGVSFLLKHGYTPVQPPYMITHEIMSKVSQLSEFEETLYSIPDAESSKYLIATSEQPLCALHQNQSIRESEAKLPIRYCGVSSCFRKEAGAHGKDIKGIFRVHQFDKIEQFCLTTPTESWTEFDRMIGLSEQFYQMLGIPYRTVCIVSGELNNSASKKIDLEGWFPAQNSTGTFRELVSCSNCTDYQSRNLNIRYIPNDPNQSKQYVHLLNSTLCANTRTICALLENYQQEDGIQLPQIFHPYLPEYVADRPGFIPFITKP